MVLALPFLRHYVMNGPKVALGDYFYRRLTRLEPPFVISLLVFLGVHVAVLGENFSDMLPHFWAGLLYAHVLVFGTPNPINPVTWSLETEAQFYLLVPLFFALLFVFRNLSWSVAIMLLSLFVSIWLRGYFTNNSINQLSSSIFAYLSNFLVGIVIAWAYLKRPKFFEQRHILWDIIGLLAIFSQFYFYKPQHHYLNNVLFNTSVLLMMISVFKGIGMNWFFTRPLVYIIGGMCYSIYLLHYAFFHLLVKYTSVIQIGVGYGTDLAFQLIICIPLVLLVSSIFFLLIEKPCMNKNWPSQFSSWVRSVLIRA
jgi:peptidoglycan/LPS O-acetylase OafA/YrhL